MGYILRINVNKDIKYDYEVKNESALFYRRIYLIIYKNVCKNMSKL